MGGGAPVTGRNYWALAAIPLAAVLAVASSTQGCDSNSASGKPRPDAGPVCSVGSGTCASGSSCVNGDCVPQCDSSGNCAAGQYCEGAAPRNVCAATQTTVCTS